MYIKSKLLQKIIHLDLTQLISFTILFLDIFAFGFDFYASFNFENFTDFDRFVLYGLFLCLFLDCFLWNEREFLSLQIAKLFILFIDGHFQMYCLITIFLWSLGFCFFNIIYLQQKKGNLLFAVANLFVLAIFCFHYIKNPLPALIILGENILICFPLYCIKILFSSREHNLYPKNTIEFLMQDFNEIPITAFSWILPFCFAFIFNLKNTSFYMVLILLAAFTLFIENVNVYKTLYRINLQIYLWAILKLGIIALLILTGVKSGLICF